MEVDVEAIDVLLTHGWSNRRIAQALRVSPGTIDQRVAQRRGHSTPILTLRTYGAFIPTGDDRKKWEQQVTDDQQRRRSAGRNA